MQKSMEATVAKVILAGATGLVGAQLAPMLAAAGHELHLLARPPVDDAPEEAVQYISDPAGWTQIVADLSPDVIISCLGTTWNKSGKSEVAFRGVDHDLVTALSKAARDAGANQAITVSSVGASSKSRNFYLRTKGEMEAALKGLVFARFDILRPGLLVGDRGSDRRPGERLGILLSPLTDLLLIGGASRYRSIPAETVARSISSMVGQSSCGSFIHENNAIHKFCC